MLLWRLYRQAHGPGLDGAGGLHAAGRWHELGSPVVYFGASAAIVVLEKLAHINPDALPTDLILTRFEADTSVEELTDFHGLDDLTQTRPRGEQFLKAKDACVLREGQAPSRRKILYRCGRFRSCRRVPDPNHYLPLRS